VCSRDFCRLAGRFYGGGDETAAEHDWIEALAAPARSGRGRRGEPGWPDYPPPGLAVRAEEAEVTVAALEMSCPCCDTPVTVVTRQSAMLLRLDPRTRSSVDLVPACRFRYSYP
jgi:hypothetical protein